MRWAVMIAGVAGCVLAARAARAGERVGALHLGLAPAPLTRSALFLKAPPPAATAPPRLRLGGKKLAGPEATTSEAGVAWAVTDRMAIQLSYRRTMFGRSVPHDVENGIGTSVRVGF